MKILGTGLSGLVGSRIVELLSDRYKFEFLEVDIADKIAVTKKIQASDASIVLHLAAKTDVDSCELDKESKGQGEAWSVNVLGTENVALACSGANKKLIYISTDFVFDGKNPPAGGYSEEKVPNPINWYGQTKYEGEKIVQDSNTQWVIVRIAYPYRAYFKRNDFVRSIISKLQRGEKITAITDHVMTPTFIDDIAVALDAIMQTDKIGIFHAVGDQFVTPFEAALNITKVFNLDVKFVGKITRGDYFRGKAPRPFNLSLNNAKIEKLGVKMRTFEEGLQEIKRQL